jgi:hypothetical protein
VDLTDSLAREAGRLGERELLEAEARGDHLGLVARQRGELGDDH